VNDDRQLRTLDPRLEPYAAALLQIIRGYQPNVYITSATRDRKTQVRLYADWINGKSQYPAAVPGTSKHERGLAFDLGNVDPRLLAAAGKLWESWGGRWGGRFKDRIHFESGSG
jgi:LAS superfamily LD-carboxypeptidase LdcB